MSHPLPWRATLAATALSAALSTAFAAAPAPRLSLPEAGASGQRAIDLLGDRLPEVAAWHKRSPEARCCATP
jgi:hypothetical protein